MVAKVFSDWRESDRLTLQELSFGSGGRGDGGDRGFRGIRGDGGDRGRTGGGGDRGDGGFSGGGGDRGDGGFSGGGGDRGDGGSAGGGGDRGDGGTTGGGGDRGDGGDRGGTGDGGDRGDAGVDLGTVGTPTPGDTGDTGDRGDRGPPATGPLRKGGTGDTGDQGDQGCTYTVTADNPRGNIRINLIPAFGRASVELTHTFDIHRTGCGEDAVFLGTVWVSTNASWGWCVERQFGDPTQDPVIRWQSYTRADVVSVQDVGGTLTNASGQNASTVGRGPWNPGLQGTVTSTGSVEVSHPSFSRNRIVSLSVTWEIYSTTTLSQPLNSDVLPQCSIF